jgi:hypothetical protein
MGGTKSRLDLGPLFIDGLLECSLSAILSSIEHPFGRNIFERC